MVLSPQQLIHFMFGSRVEFLRSADQVVLFPVRFTRR